MMATETQHEMLAYAVNLLINARESHKGEGLAPSIDYSLRAEGLAERMLKRLFTADQVDTLMTAWECSLSTNPLELPEWKSILNPE